MLPDHDVGPGPLTRCQISGSSNLELVIDLDCQPLCDSLLSKEELGRPESCYPLRCVSTFVPNRAWLSWTMSSKERSSINVRLLNEPGARDLRTHETQSTVNDGIMALLSVPYLISDKLRRNARLSSAIVWLRGVISMSGEPVLGRPESVLSDEEFAVG
jgi:hypothetical protein